MNSSDIECPQCGAIVYYELDRCPQCGLDFYPPDDQVEQNSEPARAAGWGNSLIAIGLGWLTSFMIFIILAFRLIDRDVTDWQASSLLTMAGIAFSGGYVAGAVARRLPVLHAVLVAVLNIPNAIILETMWRSNTLETLVQPRTLLVWGIILLSGVAGAMIHLLLRQRAANSQLEAIDEEDLYQDLLARVRHDQSVADRLIEFEGQRAPTASRIELIENAIERWERDNR